MYFLFSESWSETPGCMLQLHQVRAFYLKQVSDKNRLLQIFGLVLLLISGGVSSAQLVQLNRITTIAGIGTRGYSGDGGPATDARVSDVIGPSLDGAGNLYFADASNNRVRKVTVSTGIITTIAGNGTGGFSGDGGAATSAELDSPHGVAVDSSGNVYIADTSNNRVRVVTASSGTISTLVGNGTAGFSGDGGAAASAELNGPVAIAVDRSGNVYIADGNNARVRVVTASTGIITTVAGDGTIGYSGDGGPATSAALNQPLGLAVDRAKNLYIADPQNNRIRLVNASSGTITTAVGNGAAGYSGDGGPATSAELDSPSAVALDDAGNIFIVDAANHRIREVVASSGDIVTLAGNGTAGDSGDSGLATSATLQTPTGIAVGAGNGFFITDQVGAVRQVGPVAYPPTALGSSNTQNLFLQTTAAESINSFAVPISQGNKQEYTVGSVTGCVVDGVTSNPAGAICSVPVTFTPAYPGLRPVPLHALTAEGNINIGLNGIGVGPLLSLTPGILSTLAGKFAVASSSGDGGAATAATFYNPKGLTLDNGGNLYIADSQGGEVRKIDTSTGIISSVAGPGQSGSGDGGPATNAKVGPQDVALDSAGNLYIADNYEVAIRRVDAATGMITTVAGHFNNGAPPPPSSGDGGPATQAIFRTLAGVALDSHGNIYLTDNGGNQVRKVDASTGIISTVAGTGTRGYTGDGGPAASATLDGPEGVAVDLAGNVYFTDDANGVVRRVDAVTGIITTYAGNPNAPYTQGLFLSGPATSINIVANYLKFDSGGNLYIAGSDAVRRVDAVTGILTPVATGSLYSTTLDSGDGQPAIGPATGVINSPVSLALDGKGALYVTSEYEVRKIDTTTSAYYFVTNTPVGALDTTDDPQAVNLVNAGNAPLVVTAPASGSNPSVTPSSFLFDTTLNNLCPEIAAGSASGTIDPGTSCDIALDFKPLVNGRITGTMVLTDNSLNSGTGNGAANEVENIPINGKATGGSTIAPGALNFGSVTVGTSAPAQTATLSNDNGQPLTLSTPTLTDGTDFSESNNCNGTVAAGGSCIFTFTFTPKSAGALASMFTVSDTTTGAQYTVALTGTGITTSATLTPASLSFSTTAGGASAASQIATLTNTGGSPLSISSIAIAGPQASSFVSTNTCGATLAANSSCAITISFTGTAIGSYAATLTATDNASPGTQTVALTGTVAPGTTPPAPIATLTPTLLTYSSMTGAISAAQTATLTNSGTAVLNISGITITGANKSEFAISANNCASTLATGASCTVSVTFNPTSTGTDAATLSVSDNAPGSPQTSSLTGVATAPPAAADFSIAAAPASQSVTAGSSALYQVNLASIDGSFTQQIALTAAGLPPSATVTFSPAALAPGGSGAQSTMTVQTATQVAARNGLPIWPFTAPVCAALGLLFPGKRLRLGKKGRGALMSLVFLVTLLSVAVSTAGCGAGFALPSSAKTYTISVTGTSGSDTHSTSVTLTVQ